MKRFVLCLGLLLFASNANAKDITLIAGLSLPPYIIQEENRGMEYDIIKEALALKGHNLQMNYVPFVRLVVDYKKFDGAVTINESSGAEGNYSDVVITYQNYAISLKSKNLTINSIQDLKGVSTLAFQNATKYLGNEFAAMAKDNSNYAEQGNQEAQVKMLYSGRVDAIVSDINIFKFFRKKVDNMDTSVEITLHELFPGTDYKVLFNDAQIRDDFNAGLAELRASGRYKAIVDSYIQ